MFIIYNLILFFPQLSIFFNIAECRHKFIFIQKRKLKVAFHFAFLPKQTWKSNYKSYASMKRISKAIHIDGEIKLSQADLNRWPPSCNEGLKTGESH